MRCKAGPTAILFRAASRGIRGTEHDMFDRDSSRLCRCGQGGGGDLHAGMVGNWRPIAVQAEYQISRCKSGIVIVGPKFPIPTTELVGCQVAWEPSKQFCES